MTALPKLPDEGVIESYDPSDSLGWIDLSSGARLRFGRAACSFEPVAGKRVRVAKAEVGALGRPRALAVEPAGDHVPTRADRDALARSLLLGPLESYGRWRLACRLAGPSHPEHAAARGAIRDELLLARGCSAETVDEMTALATWAAKIMGPTYGRVQHAIGDVDDIFLATEVAEREKLAPSAEIERMRARLRDLGD
jgi:hypothetical protein